MATPPPRLFCRSFLEIQNPGGQINELGMNEWSHVSDMKQRSILLLLSSVQMAG